MKSKDVTVGAEYWAKVGTVRVKVRVTEKITRYNGKAAFKVCRVDNGRVLTDRNGAELHEYARG